MARSPFELWRQSIVEEVSHPEPTQPVSREPDLKCKPQLSTTESTKTVFMDFSMTLTCCSVSGWSGWAVFHSLPQFPYPIPCGHTIPGQRKRAQMLPMWAALSLGAYKRLLFNYCKWCNYKGKVIVCPFIIALLPFSSAAFLGQS